MTFEKFIFAGESRACFSGTQCTTMLQDHHNDRMTKAEPLRVTKECEDT
jgi:hypothetical protein